MGCEEIQEALDAYALGALNAAEAKAAETHLADCPQCRGYLGRANRVVGLLPLAVPLRATSQKLRQRILAAAARQAESEGSGPWRRAQRAVLALAALLVLGAAVGALAWSIQLQGRVQQLEDETTAMQRQVQFLDTRRSDAAGTLVSLSTQVDTYGQMLEEQRAVFGVLASPDVRSVHLEGRGRGQEASGHYFWSAENGIGGLACLNLPMLPKGKAYHLWLLRDGEAYDAGSFQAWNGVGLHAVNLRAMGISGPFVGFGVTIENVSSPMEAPTAEFILYAENVAR